MAVPQDEGTENAESAQSSEQTAEATTDAQPSEADALRQRATQARLRLDQLGYQTELASENYFEAQELLETTIAEIEDAEARLEANQEQLDYVSSLLSDRAVDTYRNGDLSFVEFLFGSSTITELFDRIDIVRTIMESDANMIRETRVLRAEIENTRLRLEESREIESAAAERAQEEFEAVQDSLAAQQGLLASLDDEIYSLISEQRAAIEAEQIREAEARQAAAQDEDNRVAQATPPSGSGNDSGNGDTSNQNTNRPPANNNSGSGNSGNNSGAGSGNNNSGTNTGSNNSGSGNTGGSSSGSNAGGTGTGSGSTGSGGSGGSGSGQGQTPPANNNPSLGRERPGVVTVARRFVGVTPYLWGGTTPAGFDCSGLVQFAYREAYGINLPRTSRQQFHAGVFIPPNRMDLMRPGDLVFFSATGRPADIHHVGIFIGNNRMIHAPSSGRFVSEQAIWRSDFIGAVRP